MKMPEELTYCTADGTATPQGGDGSADTAEKRAEKIVDEFFPELSR